MLQAFDLFLSHVWTICVLVFFHSSKTRRNFYWALRMNKELVFTIMIYLKLDQLYSNQTHALSPYFIFFCCSPLSCFWELIIRGDFCDWFRLTVVSTEVFQRYQICFIDSLQFFFLIPTILVVFFSSPTLGSSCVLLLKQTVPGKLYLHEFRRETKFKLKVLSTEWYKTPS